MSSSHTGILRLYFYLFKTRQLLFRKTDKVMKYLKSWNIWNISRNEYFWKGCMSKQTELFQLGHFLPYLDEEEGEWPSCCLTSRHLLSPLPQGPFLNHSPALSSPESLRCPRSSTSPMWGAAGPFISCHFYCGCQAFPCTLPSTQSLGNFLCRASLNLCFLTTWDYGK